MPENLENYIVVTGLEKVSFHSNPKEGQCQKMFKLSHNCAHFTSQQDNAQNSSSQTSTVRELRISRCKSRFRKSRETRDQIVNICWIIEKARESKKKKIYVCFIDYTKAFDCEAYNKLENSQRWEYQTTLLIS